MGKYKGIAGVLILLTIVTVIILEVLNQNQFKSDITVNVSMEKILEDFAEYKYPYSELSNTERTQVLEYNIKQLSEQCSNYEPGKCSTLCYIENTLGHMKALLANPQQTAEEGTVVSADINSKPVSINMIYYGWNDPIAEQRIINAHPKYLVDNSPAGPWKGNADISKFKAAGIDYYEYIDGGYEGTAARAIPNDLQSNLKFISAVAGTGASGIFLDEVSPYPTKAGLVYLQKIADAAHSLGLKVVFNTGVGDWSDTLMNFADYIQSSETWHGSPLTPSQSKWKDRTWVLTQGVNSAQSAADITEDAWRENLQASYVCNTYVALPDWLESYISNLTRLTKTNDHL